MYALISRHLKIIPGFHYDLLSKQATNYNPLCFEKTGNAFAHLRCSTQSIMKNSAVFSPCSSLHFHKYRIGRVKRKKVELYKTVDLRWRTFCLRNMDECFHHPFTCVVAGPTSCGKTEFMAKFNGRQILLKTLLCKKWYDYTNFVTERGETD